MKPGIDLNIIMQRQCEFTPEQYGAFLRCIGGRSATQVSAGRLAALPFAEWYGFYFLSRFTYYPNDDGSAGHFMYTAGQSHPDEMRRVRDAIRAQYR